MEESIKGLILEVARDNDLMLAVGRWVVGIAATLVALAVTGTLSWAGFKVLGWGRRAAGRRIRAGLASIVRAEMEAPRTKPADREQSLI